MPNFSAMLDIRYFNQFASLYSTSFLYSIIKNEHFPLISVLLNESRYNSISNNKEITLAGLLDHIYKYMCYHYRFEYIYKNAIVTKRVLNRHLLNSSVLFSEFRACNSKADLVIINDTSNIYEIKTERDKLERLEYQLNSYKKVFDKIFIVTSEQNISKLLKIISKDIGLIILSNKYSLKTIREAKSNKKNVIPSSIFDSLTKKEYSFIINDKFGFVPEVPNTEIYSVCKKLFCSLSSEVAHNYMVKALKRRAIGIYQRKLVNNVPSSLKLMCMLGKMTNKSCTILNQRLFSIFEYQSK